VIYATAGSIIQPLLQNAPPGLGVALSVRVLDPPSTVILAERTAGIQEIASGAYTVELELPSDVPAFGETATWLVIWRNIAADPDVEVLEELQVSGHYVPTAPPAPGQLATIADVRRLAPGTSGKTDEEVGYALEVAESYLRERLLPFTETATERLYGVRGNQVIFLRPEITVAAVRTWDAHDGASYLRATPADFLPTTEGVRLMHSSETTWPRVEVDYVWAGDVPPAVREGVALTAANFLVTLPQLASGLRSERIGDYSYTFSDKDLEAAIPRRALQLMRPWLRRPRVWVV
jgi:hypothetical protein